MNWKQPEGHLPLGISTPATMVVGGQPPKHSPRNYQEPAWERVFEDTRALRISTWAHLGLTPQASDIATDSSIKRKGADTEQYVNRAGITYGAAHLWMKKLQGLPAKTRIWEQGMDELPLWSILFFFFDSCSQSLVGEYISVSLYYLVSSNFFLQQP